MARESSASVTPALRMHLLDDQLARVARDAGQRRRQRADDLGVELGAREPPDLPQCVAGRPRAAIRTLAGDGVVRVGDVYDARGHRNLIAAQSVRVAASVGALVVELDDR